MVKPRRKKYREKAYEDDFSEVSGSKSHSCENEFYKEVDGQSVREGEDGDSAYVGFESMSNTPYEDQTPFPKAPQFVNHNADVDATEALNFASNLPSQPQPITQNASYINVAPLPVFRGTPDECPINHLSRFSKVCRANNVSSIDMMMKIFPITLEDEAALWYDLNIEPYPSLSWDDIKSSFLQAYHKVELVEELRSELMSLNQNEEESVRSYFLRLQWILNRWPEHGLSDSLLKRIFVQGLREEFHDWIILNKPNSLNDALKLAFSFEQMKRVRVAKEKVFICGFCDGMHKEKECEVKGKLREMWKQIKEKQGTCNLLKSGVNEMANRLSRSASIGESNGDEGNEEGEIKRWNSNKSQSCQCSKHQCWKKKLLKNNSIMSRASDAE